MARLRISRLAGGDLDEIRVVGEERFGPAATLRHLGSLGRAFDLLRDQPLAGQARPEYGEGIRSITRRPHRILYRLVHGEVEIVRVIHAARDARLDLTDDE
ncbi:hypothetical protein ASG29_11175 [Sphingomonas sp. Leaf412]|uniref:type II toxin-antitoxin system RelE/ParE family toxin n=1 Tax=Sphingomonas sp. Leaf412 TaxID=1736370 RepID=UPI0006F1EEE6|nr:type II toxin-antitoxin system RelE/ParE family toxin [Sphingomonas sp. Leaf412]KQT32357.1 hypothetical protein ASG29_11175 [Sphingomonas sp. Leaf412]